VCLRLDGFGWCTVYNGLEHGSGAYMYKGWRCAFFNATLAGQTARPPGTLKVA